METLLKAHLHDGQAEVQQAHSRFKVLAAGRRWGKTRLGVNECLATALQGGTAWWVAPTYKMCDVGWRPLIKMARMLDNAEILKAEHTIRLPGGGWVGIRSADNPDSLRGDGLDLAIMDECAYMRWETWSEVIRPALSDKMGRALFISTPKGRNWFWNVYQKGLRGDKNWRSFHFTSYDNPYLHKEEIDDARKDIPESVFRQEYLAEFIESEGAVFRNVDRCAVLKPAEPNWQRSYAGGADIASVDDFTVITILDSETREMAWQERFNRVDYPILERRIIETYHRWHLKSLTVEVNGVGKGVIDHLRREEGLNIIPFLTSNKSKQEIIQNLQVAFEREEIRVLDDNYLKHELLSFESSRLVSGGFQYKAPAGGHDDCVMALAIAWDSLRVMERRFEPLTIAGEDPVDVIDNGQEM